MTEPVGRVDRTPNSRCPLFDCSGCRHRTPNSANSVRKRTPNKSNTEQLVISEQSEHRTGRTAHFERTARTPNSPNTKNFQNFRTGRTVRTPIWTLVDPACRQAVGDNQKMSVTYSINIHHQRPMLPILLQLLGFFIITFISFLSSRNLYHF